MVLSGIALLHADDGYSRHENFACSQYGFDLFASMVQEVGSLRG